MTSAASRTERTGRILALAGLILTALGLRTAVVAISPIADAIGEDIALGSVGLGVIGMLAPIAFAAAALLTPAIVRRLGLERTMIAALVAMAAGHIGRALAPEFVTLAGGSVLVLVGMGVANVLLPPIVRRYFPGRIGAVTSLSTTLLAVSAAVPALVAAPIATAAGWRVAVGIWGSLSLLALLPWIPLSARLPREGAALAQPEPTLLWSMARSRTAIAIAIIFATTSTAVYSFFAWLPQILMERTSLDAVGAGALLSLFGIAGFPVNLLVPLLAARMKSVAPLVFVGVALFVIGYSGLLVAPETATWAWILLGGFGALLFPLALTLIALRTRTAEGTVALSGFVQGTGYGVAAFGPLLVGVLHSVTGDYRSALAVLIALSLPAIGAGFVLRRARFVEDEILESKVVDAAP